VHHLPKKAHGRRSASVPFNSVVVPATESQVAWTCVTVWDYWLCLSLKRNSVYAWLDCGILVSPTTRAFLNVQHVVPSYLTQLTPVSMYMYCQPLSPLLYRSHVLWGSDCPASSSFVRFGKIDYKKRKDWVWPVYQVVILTGSIFIWDTPIKRGFPMHLAFSQWASSYHSWQMRNPLDHERSLVYTDLCQTKWMDPYCQIKLWWPIFMNNAAMPHFFFALSHSRLTHVSKMERFITVLHHECGRSGIDNFSKTLSGATISSE
jgi:hypothetical protein